MRHIAVEATGQRKGIRRPDPNARRGEGHAVLRGAELNQCRMMA
ncbi:hypothetical protein [Sphingobium algorifonticola]|nr:hypothetical protein [Sphingobium algorifonticola]